MGIEHEQLINTICKLKGCILYVNTVFCWEQSCQKSLQQIFESPSQSFEQIYTLVFYDANFRVFSFSRV